mmetsp:Transcript_12478/g.39491  ORF Transcript_12478/g.39491 Transcript_12478/m.39491 type:complete len:247 (+) Transcript_12478:2317-3057(+)
MEVPQVVVDPRVVASELAARIQVEARPARGRRHRMAVAHPRVGGEVLELLPLAGLKGEAPRVRRPDPPVNVHAIPQGHGHMEVALFWPGEVFAGRLYLLPGVGIEVEPPKVTEVISRNVPLVTVDARPAVRAPEDPQAALVQHSCVPVPRVGVVLAVDVPVVLGVEQGPPADPGGEAPRVVLPGRAAGRLVVEVPVRRDHVAPVYHGRVAVADGWRASVAPWLLIGLLVGRRPGGGGAAARRQVQR